MAKLLETEPEYKGANTLPIDSAAGLISFIQEMLTKLRERQPIEAELKVLRELDFAWLTEAMADEQVKMAFWINVYNVFNLYGMLRQAVKTNGDKRRHFMGRSIVVARCLLSLNDIEHGILRRNKVWWAKGWLTKPWARRPIRLWKVLRFDPRIHFALNCGANGCPAIRYYSAAALEDELEMAAKAFFALEVEANGEAISVSAIFNMYLGDFGGRRGLNSWLRKYRPDLELTKRIEFAPYDWTTNLDKFAEA